MKKLIPITAYIVVIIILIVIVVIRNIKISKKIKKYIEDLETEKNLILSAPILNELSRFDIGQSIVVLNGRVLGIEGAEGTQELIKRCGKYYHDMCALNSNVRKRRPVLIKKSKLNQNQKLDMPTIGEQSIVDLVDNSFAGIALERDGVLMLDKPVIRQLCEKYNFFLKVM